MRRAGLVRTIAKDTPLSSLVVSIGSSPSTMDKKQFRQPRPGWFTNRHRRCLDRPMSLGKKHACEISTVVRLFDHFGLINDKKNRGCPAPCKVRPR